MEASGKVKSAFGRVEHAHHHHFMAARTQVREAFAQLLGRGQQIGDQNDQTPLGTSSAMCSNRAAQVGVFAGQRRFPG